MVEDELAVATEESASNDEEAAAAAPSLELDQLRELIAKAHPDTVPELLQGATLAELLLSVPAAQAAYARVAEAARASDSPPVAAGATLRSPEGRAEGLSPLAKIRAGLTRRG